MGKSSGTATSPVRGVLLEDVRQLILRLPNVSEGRSYGLPSFLLNGRFLARFRDRDTVLVLQLATIEDRDFLMQLEPRAFFFTEHYRNYPAVLVRLAEAPPALLRRVVSNSWRHVSTLPPLRSRPSRSGGTRRRRAAT